MAHEGASSAGKGRILVVDDEFDSREVVSGLLRREGYDVVVVSSVREALAEAQRADFGLVISDMWMPGGSGIELIEKLAKLRPRLEVVAISGFATEATRAKVLELGCFELVEKAFPEKLLEVASKAVGGDRLERLGAVGKAAPKRDFGRVLLADDEPTYTEMMNEFLRKHGYEVTIARNGREAVTAFDSGEFDLVITDITMPEMDGIEVTKHIRKRDRAIAILVISGEAASGELHKVLAVGADSMLSKPVDLPRLESKVTEYLELTRHRRRRAIRKRHEESRGTAEKITHWLTSTRTKRRRQKTLVTAAAVVFALMGGLLATELVDLVCNAGRMTKSVVARFAGRLDRLEGYLERDEKRELDQQRRNPNSRP